LLTAIFAALSGDAKDFFGAYFKAPMIPHIVTQGDMLLVAATLSGTVMGELLTSSSPADASWKIAVGGASVSVLLGATMMYTSLKVLPTATISTFYTRIRNATFILLAVCFVSTTFGIVISKAQVHP
jgi:hypothetical protein